jgi:RNA polymerase sigma-70 factor (ECF subfamily)
MAAIDQDGGRVAQCLKGEPDAFEELIREHQRMIHALCYRMTGSLADAEDLAQETFIQAYQHLSDFRAEARFSSWLYRIAMNQCLNWQKRTQHRQALHREWSEQDQDLREPRSPSADEVQQALMKLDPKRRAAVVLTIYDGLTHAEAAKALGCSETTVSWRVFMARRTLKGLLKGLAGPRSDA